MSDRFEFSPFGMAKPGVKTVKLGDMYTPDMLRKARTLWNTYVTDAHSARTYGQIKDVLRDEIVKPRLAHINEVTGQENDADFLAYQLVAVFQSFGRGGPPLNWTTL